MVDNIMISIIVLGVIGFLIFGFLIDYGKRLGINSSCKFIAESIDLVDNINRENSELRIQLNINRDKLDKIQSWIDNGFFMNEVFYE